MGTKSEENKKFTKNMDSSEDNDSLKADKIDSDSSDHEDNESVQSDGLGSDKEEENVENDSKPIKVRKPRTIVSEEELAKTGIIYLSRIPTLMNKDILRRYFENFGEIGRIWLELDTKAPQRGKRLIFSEGWIEFKDKRMAKRVAQTLNNTQCGGKKRYAWSEEIWNIKYLNRFKWVHLHERLAYEKAVHQQRMRTEISQAKRETNFYIENAEKNERLRRKERRKGKPKDSVEDKGDVQDNEGKGGNDNETSEQDRVYSFRLKETEEEIVGKKRKRAGKFENKNKKPKKEKKQTVAKPQNKSFLTKIFGGGD